MNPMESPWGQAVGVQAQIRLDAQEQSDAFAGVAQWFNEIKSKDEQISKRKAKPNAQPTSGVRVQTPTAPSYRTAETKEDVASGLKRRGNELMESGAHREAISAYTKALTHTPNDWTIYANRSQAFVNCREYRSAIFDATAALRINSVHVKSWYRRGLARNSLGLHEAALRDLAVAAMLEPGNRAAQVELRKTQENLRSSVKRMPDISLPIAASGE